GHSSLARLAGPRARSPGPADQRGADRRPAGVDEAILMRALQLSGPRRAEIVDVPTPTPGPNQVLVRLQGCGLCGSNLSPWQGRPWFRYPLEPGAPGHEGWGRVAAVGSEVGGVRVGDRVALLSERAFAEYDVADADAIVPLPEALD